MEEKFFIVTEAANMHKDYFTWKANAGYVRSLVNAFFKEQGIEAEEYHVTNDDLMIVPTAADIERFNNVLGVKFQNGLRKFNKSSKVTKAWKKKLSEASLQVLRKPQPIFYFRTNSGRYTSRLFDIDGILYCSISNTKGDIPEGLDEIKTSEFFKVIEDYEAKEAVS
jgi:hypothetical protein